MWSRRSESTGGFTGGNVGLDITTTTTQEEVDRVQEIGENVDFSESRSIIPLDDKITVDGVKFEPEEIQLTVKNESEVDVEQIMCVEVGQVFHVKEDTTIAQGEVDRVQETGENVDFSEPRRVPPVPLDNKITVDGACQEVKVEPEEIQLIIKNEVDVEQMMCVEVGEVFQVKEEAPLPIPPPKPKLSKRKTLMEPQFQSKRLSKCFPSAPKVLRKIKPTPIRGFGKSSHFSVPQKVIEGPSSSTPTSPPGDKEVTTTSSVLSSQSVNPTEPGAAEAELQCNLLIKEERVSPTREQEIRKGVLEYFANEYVQKHFDKAASHSSSNLTLDSEKIREVALPHSSPSSSSASHSNNPNTRTYSELAKLKVTSSKKQVRKKSVKTYPEYLNDYARLPPPPPYYGIPPQKIDNPLPQVAKKKYHFKCKECSALIKDQGESLQKHLQLHEDEDGPPGLKQICLVCGWFIENICEHNEQWHSPENMELNSWALLPNFWMVDSSHPDYTLFRQENISRYNCKHCPAEVYKLEEIEEHFKLHDKREGIPCWSCKWLVAPGKQKEHEERYHVHAIDDVDVTDDGVAASTSGLPLKKVIFYDCQDCGVTCWAEDKFEHMLLHNKSRAHEAATCEVCGFLVKTECLSNHKDYFHPDGR